MALIATRLSPVLGWISGRLRGPLLMLMSFTTSVSSGLVKLEFLPALSVRLWEHHFRRKLKRIISAICLLILQKLHINLLLIFLTEKPLTADKDLLSNHILMLLMPKIPTPERFFRRL